MPGQVGVPGVAVDQVDALDPGGDRQVGGEGPQGSQVAAAARQGVPGPVSGHLGGAGRPGRAGVAEAVHLQVE